MRKASWSQGKRARGCGSVWERSLTEFILT